MQPTLPEWTVVGFSGHRAVEDERSAASGIRAALDRVLARRTPLAAIASVAAGGDTIFLEESARRLARAQTWTGVWRVAVETEECLFGEVSEWHSLSLFSQEAH
jgi:hypothetical protein